mmetsp:Transcript_50216/g.162721  ORF Transcript_50216/g.162721 Transcript_50216/m.162721 type:complete len:208 (-) Transcript_50216:1044-1667(-)
MAPASGLLVAVSMAHTSAAPSEERTCAAAALPAHTSDADAREMEDRSRNRVSTCRVPRRSAPPRGAVRASASPLPGKGKEERAVPPASSASTAALRRLASSERPPERAARSAWCDEAGTGASSADTASASPHFFLPSRHAGPPCTTAGQLSGGSRPPAPEAKRRGLPCPSGRVSPASAAAVSKVVYECCRGSPKASLTRPEPLTESV